MERQSGISEEEREKKEDLKKIKKKRSQKNLFIHIIVISKIS